MFDQCVAPFQQLSNMHEIQKCSCDFINAFFRFNKKKKKTWNLSNNYSETNALLKILR